MPKFQASTLLLGLNRPVCVGPGGKPNLFVSSRGSSYSVHVFVQLCFSYKRAHECCSQCTNDAIELKHFSFLKILMWPCYLVVYHKVCLLFLITMYLSFCLSILYDQANKLANRFFVHHRMSLTSTKRR